MSDLDDDDIDDLFADFEETDAVDSAMISANLLDASGIDPSTVAAVHAGEADEGRITWVAPEFSGLTNSTSVDTKGGHWNRDDAAAPPPAAPVAPPTAPVAAAPPAATASGGPASTAAVVAEAAPEDVASANRSTATARARAEVALWDEAGVGGASPAAARPNQSESVRRAVADEDAVKKLSAQLDADAARSAAALFERLAKHGRKETMLSREEYRALVAQLTETKHGKELLACLVQRRRDRKISKERMGGSGRLDTAMGAVSMGA